jgi:hypothetical protein
MEKKFFSAFPEHLDVQPIPSIISSLEFDNPQENCFAISGSLLACFEGFSEDDDS